MALPQNITRDHLLQAFSKIENEDIPKDADSQYYDVVWNGKRFPPKLVVSYANIFANGEELDRRLFDGGIGSACFTILEINGFEIRPKPVTNDEPNFWFVAQGRTFTQEEGMKYLWAPKANKNGKYQVYWLNVLRIKKGDIIFQYSFFSICLFCNFIICNGIGLCEVFYWGFPQTL